MRLAWALVAGVLSAGASIAAYGQQTGEVTGTVTDASGAVIVGATITATNTATQQVRTAVSNVTGNYALPYLLPGTYNVQAQRTGFQQVTNPGVVVQVGAVLRLDFHMTVGAVTQHVVVTTAEPLLSTESVAVQTTIGNSQIVSLPLNGRDYLQLVALTPNVVNEATSSGGSSLQGGVRIQESIAVAGQRLEFNHYTLDGVENTDPNFNSYIIHPSIDALQEFTVNTGVYSAEFGRGAAQINATTKSGTNVYHGVAFDFIRNDYVDAELWNQIGRKNPFHRNDYGFTLGGPLSIPKVFNAKNKLFFMSNFEDLGDHEYLQEIGSVPTAAMRAGNLSVATIPQIYDPATRTFTSTGGSAVPFTGNIIPTNRLSPQAQAILNYFPLPNVPGTGYANDYVAESPQPTEETQFNQRVDWTENQKSSWFYRFSWENDLSSPATLFPDADAANTVTTVRQAVIGNTLIFSPNVVNDARFAWDQFNNNYQGYYSNSSTDVQGGLGIAGFSAANPQFYGVPAIGLGEGISGGGGVTPWITRDDLFEWTDSVSIVKGAHSMKAGGMIERDRYNQYGNQKSVGEFDFDGQSTDDPANPTKTGFVSADFLLGYSSQYYRVTSIPQAELRRTDYAAFFEDDWKVTHQMTLNLGLRYENTRPWYDNHDGILNADILSSGVTTASAPPYTTSVSTLIANAPNPILTRPGSGDFYQNMGFQYASNTVCNEIGDCDSQQIQRGNQYLGRSTMEPNNWDFGPRIGLDYALGTKWSLRAGFGIFYASDIGNAVFDMARNLGGKDGTVVSPNQRTVSMASPWAAEVGSLDCPGYTGPCVSAPQIQANGHTNRTPYIEQYMANIQRQLTPHLAVEVGYLGNEAQRLDRDLVINQAVPKSGPTDTSSTTARRPFPAYGPIQCDCDWDRAVYDAGDVKLTQQLSHGLLYVIAFTWSHSIDFGSALRSNAGDTLWPTNSYNQAAERGNSQFDLPRRFVASFLYNLPFGADQTFLKAGAASHILGGWQIGGIVTLADGTPENAAQLGDTAGLGTLGNQPFATGASYIPANRSATHYWNAAAFDYTNPNLNWEPGNMGRNTLFSPGSEDFDSNVTRNFHIWESQTLQFRIEAFNTLNHPNLNSPSSDARTPTFGVITSAQPMRELQAALKYSF